MSGLPAAYATIYAFLVEQGHDKAAAAVKKAARPTSDSSSESDSSSSGSSSSSSSNSSSDSDSDEEKGKGKAETKAPAKTAAKESSESSSESESSDDSSDESSSSESESDAPPAKKRKLDTPAAAQSVTTTTTKTKTVAVTATVTKSTTSANGNQPTRNGKTKDPRKPIVPFSRIKADDVVYADPRLMDNRFTNKVRLGLAYFVPPPTSYVFDTPAFGLLHSSRHLRVKPTRHLRIRSPSVPKPNLTPKFQGGTAGDYGERAARDLIVTRGVGFRKEKNKKKRGSYRGGEITAGSEK
ncbi:hypothetical protein FRC06_010207 [Ceratobasidium sp. 370]|nr:hypothetical protein FRC06_010207 [Ceratobasidium sp. 370]